MIPFLLSIVGGYLIGDSINETPKEYSNGGRVDMEMLEMDLKLINKKYPNAKVSYFFLKDKSGKGYVIQAKENNKIVYSSYEKEN
jgi:hypothetical protein